jgi:hypothetical protein
VRIRPGDARTAVACAAGERLVSGWSAVGFYGASSPSSALIQSVTAVPSVRGARFEVRVRAAAVVRAVRGIVQLGVVCGGAS